MLFIQTLRLHKELALKNLFATLMILVCCAIAIDYSIREGSLLHCLGYMFAVWLCMFITDLVIQWRPKDSIGFPIWKPVGKELRVIFICTALGLVFLIFRFTSDWDNLANIIKLVTIPFMLFTFPVALAAIYIFGFKYKFKELGFNFNYWYLPIFIHLVIGITAMLVAPEKSHWRDAINQYGILMMMINGFLAAALSEEFLRMLMQSRIGAAINNMPMAIVIASVIWALMHTPVNIKNNPGVDILSVLKGSLNIVPIGVLWGYMTYRTKSLFPTIMLHGLNLWGLQNL